MTIQAPDQASQAGGITTPSFSGAEIPGVPAPQQDPNARAAQILQLLKTVASQKHMANTAVPQGITPMEDPRSAQRIGMDTANPNAWGKQRFFTGVGINIRNAVRQQKEKQLTAAEGDWTYLQSAMNELYAAQSSGDPNAQAAAQKKVDFILSDQKKLKNMAKALNQDWLNPEKTTVYGEALKTVAQKSGQQASAMSNLKNMVMKLVGQKQQLQMSNEQLKRMAAEIQSRAPVTESGPDKESAMALREELRAEEKERADAKKAADKAAEDEQKETWRREDESMKQKYQMQRDQMNNSFHQSMESMKELHAEQRQSSHDMMMMKALGMKLDAQTEKMFKPDPTKLNKEVTDTVGTLKQQLAQSQQNLRSIRSQASTHWLTGPGKDDIADAQKTVDAYTKAIAHLEKNRDAIIKGKADLGEVIDKAYSIMGGADEAQEAVPGFQADSQPNRGKL